MVMIYKLPFPPVLKFISESIRITSPLSAVEDPEVEHKQAKKETLQRVGMVFQNQFSWGWQLEVRSNNR